MTPTDSPSARQVGGDHYKDMAIQPAVFIRANRIPYHEGCVIKYICRHARKGGREDLEKAKHYIDLILESDYPDPLKAQFETLVQSVWNMPEEQLVAELKECGMEFEPSFTLPDPPPGRQWHRDDFTTDMLPPVTDGGLPWRPLLKDEPIVWGQKCDEFASDYASGEFHWQSEYRTEPQYPNAGFWRTRRPLPQPAPALDREVCRWTQCSGGITGVEYRTCKGDRFFSHFNPTPEKCPVCNKPVELS